jgi:hemerythrin-like metal-binding protein
MWKESYKIGMDLIDAQHRELFENTERLLRMIQGADAAAKKQECINTILFLKDYAVRHFATEEEYQRSIGYGDLDAHIAIHNSFVDSVLESEKKMTEADFSLPAIKEFAGFLTAWLTYHVAGVDQKLKKGEQLSSGAGPSEGSVADYFSQSVKYVLEAMVDNAGGDIVPTAGVDVEDGIRVLFALTGERQGEIIISFPNNTAISLTKAMTFMDDHQVDEMSNSAMSEVANIISADAVSMIAASGVEVGLEKPQILLDSEKTDAKEGFYFDSGHGRIGVSININKGDSKT